MRQEILPKSSRNPPVLRLKKGCGGACDARRLRCCNAMTPVFASAPANAMLPDGNNRNDRRAGLR
jgi:hypothetical protein